MLYYCTKCGAKNVRQKMKSNYGCAMFAIDLLLLVAIPFTFGISLLGMIIIACCVKKTPICRHCDGVDCLIPMDSPNVPR